MSSFSSENTGCMPTLAQYTAPDLRQWITSVVKPRCSNHLVFHMPFRYDLCFRSLKQVNQVKAVNLSKYIFRHLGEGGIYPFDAACGVCDSNRIRCVACN